MPILDLARVPYRDALALQHRLVDARRAGAIADTLLLLEHPAVLTVGRAGGQDNVVAAPALLHRLGIEVVEVERGGNVTYHGPGQIVGYLIADLTPRGRDLHRFLRELEEMLIRTVARFGVEATRVPGKTGIWVDGAKLASIGVAVREWITYHGFALNVRTDLTHFNLIVPCGIQNVRMCSLVSLADTGDPAAPRSLPPDMPAIRRALAEEAHGVFGVELAPWASDAEALLGGTVRSSRVVSHER
jgi:lipoate-protein ligase B